MTNLGTLRAYVQRYLENHPKIHSDMTLMVRQLAPTQTGFPLSIFCFTTTPPCPDFAGFHAATITPPLSLYPLLPRPTT